MDQNAARGKNMKASQDMKKEKIAALKEKKAILHPLARRAFRKYDALRQAHYKAEEEYLEIKKQMEDLDREEKLLFYSISKNQPCKKKKPSKDAAKKIAEDAKKAAMKALDNLPKAVRDQIIANFK